jgi:hypothetical protein
VTFEPRTTLAGQERFWEVRRYGPLSLSAGQHDIDVGLTGPHIGDPLTESVPVSWIFGVMVVDDRGAPLARCAQVVGEPE